MGHGSLRMYTRQTHDSGNRRLRRARYSPQCARGNRRRRLRRAFAYPGSIDSADPRRPRHDRPGADRYRQDRRVRPAAAVAHRPEPPRAADAGAGADPRAGPAGRHRLRNLFQAIAGRRRGRRLRRRAHGAAAEGPAPGRTDPRRYPPAACATTCAATRSCWPPSSAWCSTKPTRCSSSASWTTWK